VAISRDGTRISAVAPGPVPNPSGSALDSAITVFDTHPLRDGKPPAFVAKIPVSARPTRVVDAGDRLFVSFVHEANPPKSANVLVIDASKLTSGKAAIMGRLPIAGQEIALASDGRTLFASQAGYTKLAVIDLQRVTLEPAAD
jgi:hypothetical protein